MNKKRLKGFTLIEMIIVVAIFGMIMAAVLSLLDPVRKVYTRTYVESDAQSISENMRRYVGDQIQYADRLYAYTNMTMDDTVIQDQVNDFRNKFYFVAGTGVPTGETTAVTKERVYPYSAFKGNDEIYVLHIENPDPSIDFSSGTVTLPVSGSMLGKISVSTYKGGVKQPDTFVWSEVTDYYEDYAFDITLQSAVKVSAGGTDEYKFVDIDGTADPMTSKINPNNLAMGIKMYRKTPIKGNYSNASVEDSYVNRTITFKLKNLISKTNALSDEIIEFQNDKFSNENVRRFRWFDNTKAPNAESVSGASASKDIYFIYTKVPYIEKIS
ncbi:MAG: type II secretion system protein [Oscillospiraceae bacterium]|nr:type II secretion system protein [Oscillospiraceae bacterium]